MKDIRCATQKLETRLSIKILNQRKRILKKSFTAKDSMGKLGIFSNVIINQTASLDYDDIQIVLKNQYTKTLVFTRDMTDSILVPI